jgi:hypothetical protein
MDEGQQPVRVAANQGIHRLPVAADGPVHQGLISFTRMLHVVPPAASVHLFAPRRRFVEAKIGECSKFKFFGRIHRYVTPIRNQRKVTNDMYAFAFPEKAV